MNGTRIVAHYCAVRRPGDKLRKTISEARGSSNFEKLQCCYQVSGVVPSLGCPRFEHGPEPGMRGPVFGHGPCLGLEGSWVWVWSRAWDSRGSCVRAWSRAEDPVGCPRFEHGPKPRREGVMGSSVVSSLGPGGLGFERDLEPRTGGSWDQGGPGFERGPEPGNDGVLGSGVVPSLGSARRGWVLDLGIFLSLGSRRGSWVRAWSQTWDPGELGEVLGRAWF
ncbi:hypothetical protein FXO38_05225 [Capsicum annuum]|nr:hypothetical protein FXO38_05225 [Capsicum annuum]